VLAGLAPVTTGLVCSSAALITQASVQTWSLGLIVLGVAAAASRTRLHPLLLLAACAAFGLTGIGQG
jgi:chromate transporter